MRLGIVGGGQLGMYLCEAAQAMGVHTCVLTDDDDAPARFRARQTIVGQLWDDAVLDYFSSCCDVVTFEKEDIPNEGLSRLLLAEQEGRVRLNPGARVLFLLKDKGLQKSWLARQGFPTLPYRIISGFQPDTGSLARELELPLVQKARCGGYDGRGVQVLDNRTALETMLWPIPSVIEKYLPNAREIAVITARNARGEQSSYPPFGMEFDARLNILQLVTSRANIPAPLAAAATRLAEQVVSRLGGIGVFAVEMFITASDELLINEISPRVHNSGHLTMEASATSQFEQHVRAVLDMPLASCDAVAPAAMVNLLYHRGLAGRCPPQPGAVIARDGNAAVHWYGKPMGREGRKMGHITALGASVAAAAERAAATLAELAHQPRNEAA